MFCNLFICWIFDGLLQSICFQMFFSKHSITFDTYLLSCLFHFVDIKFRSSVTFTVTNFWGNTITDLKHCLTLELLSVNLSYITNVYFRLVYIQMFCISNLALLHFTFHWYWFILQKYYGKNVVYFSCVKTLEGFQRFV